MNDFLFLALSLAWGVVLGIFYFGGLWLTLRHLPYSEQPAFLTLGSFLGRSIVCLFGFYLIAINGWDGLVLSLAGFILAKLALTHRLGHHENMEAS
jgi:F1F0 ATPase subunit 2